MSLTFLSVLPAISENIIFNNGFRGLLDFWSQRRCKEKILLPLSALLICLFKELPVKKSDPWSQLSSTALLVGIGAGAIALLLLLLLLAVCILMIAVRKKNKRNELLSSRLDLIHYNYSPHGRSYLILCRSMPIYSRSICRNPTLSVFQILL